MSTEQKLATVMRRIRSLSGELTPVAGLPPTTSVKREHFFAQLDLLTVRQAGRTPRRGLEVSFMAVLGALDSWQGDSRSPALDFGRFDDYVGALWTVSLARLLGGDRFLIARTAARVGNAGRDVLFERLVHDAAPARTPATRALHGKVFAELAALPDHDGAAKLRIARHHLDHWMYAMRHAWFMGERIGADRLCGPAAFELAAILDLAGCDASALANHRFFPRRLVGDDGKIIRSAGPRRTWTYCLALA